MTGIAIEDYRRAESLGLRGLSNDHIRAFSPVTFDRSGYPVRVACEADIVRYLDTMQELNSPEALLNEADFTMAEARLIEGACEAALSVSRALCGKALRPWLGPLATMPLFRAVEAVAASVGLDSLRILEVGPGSGHLGALLVQRGHTYHATDIAEGFYLWQSHYLSALAGPEFREGAGLEAADGLTARVMHIPWWHYATLYRSEPEPYDVILCDHALGEMHPYALRYLCQLSADQLSQGTPGVFIYSSIGAPEVSSEEAVRLNFERVGLDRLFCGAVTVIAQRNNKPPKRVHDLEHQVPLFDGGTEPGTERVKGRDIIPIVPLEAPPSYEFYEYLGYPTPASIQPRLSG